MSEHRFYLGQIVTITAPDSEHVGKTGRIYAMPAEQGPTKDIYTVVFGNGKYGPWDDFPGGVFRDDDLAYAGECWTVGVLDNNSYRDALFVTEWDAEEYAREFGRGGGIGIWHYENGSSDPELVSIAFGSRIFKP